MNFWLLLPRLIAKIFSQPTFSALADKAAQNEQEDRLIMEFDAIENKNQRPIFAEQADENSAL